MPGLAESRPYADPGNVGVRVGSRPVAVVRFDGAGPLAILRL
jgi:hypothetical protein